jgi:hypothetical protein
MFIHTRPRAGEENARSCDEGGARGGLDEQQEQNQGTPDGSRRGAVLAEFSLQVGTQLKLENRKIHGKIGGKRRTRVVS